MLEEVSNSALDAVERATLKDRETPFIYFFCSGTGRT